MVNYKSHYFRVFGKNLSFITSLNSKMTRWYSFTGKIIVTSQTKKTFIQAICHKVENVGLSFFKDHPNAIRFNLVQLCPSMLLFPFAVFLLRCSTVLNGYCNASFHFMSILGVKITSFCVT